MNEKMAPVQGFAPGIPWSLHLEAYDVYRKKYGDQPALIDLESHGCRGGFHAGELDNFIPDWRERASEIARLKAALAAKDAEIEQLRGLFNKSKDEFHAARAEIDRLTADRDEWKESTIDANLLYKTAVRSVATLIAERDALLKERKNAKALLVEVYAMLPEQAVAARQTISRKSGPWFVWGVDRSEPDAIDRAAMAKGAAK